MDDGLFPTPNEKLVYQIKDLEAKSARAVREHLLGDATALARIQTWDSQIVALRAQLTLEQK